MASRPGLWRLDELLVRQGFAPTREKAKALVLAGSVVVPGVAAPKPGLMLRSDAALVVSSAAAYVSRGGLKLAHALDRFGVSPNGQACADLGASTGGFTDCLLQRGARKVYAVDVGYGQLNWNLRQDPRVVTMERTNARYLERLPESVQIVTIDASFISLRLLLPAARRIGDPETQVIALIKPQFEAGRGKVGKGGVVRDPAVHREILEGFASWLPAESCSLLGLTASPIRGPAGNVEFLAHILLQSAGFGGDLAELIDVSLAEAAALIDESALD